MVDTDAVAGSARGHRGTVHALSRHGLLRHRHARSGTYVSPPIRAVLRALRPHHSVPSGARAVLHLLREEVARAEQTGANWRAWWWTRCGR